MRITTLVALALAATAIPFAPAEAAHHSTGRLDVHLTGGETWEAAILNKNVGGTAGVDVRVWINWSSNPGPDLAAFWFKGQSGANAVFTSALMYQEHGSTRVVANMNGGNVIFEGSTPDNRAPKWFFSFPHQSITFDRVAFSAPGAVDAHLQISWSTTGASVSSRYSGSDHIRAANSDFVGTWTEAAVEQPGVNGLEYGASASYGATYTASIAAGMIAVFASDNSYSLLRVDGPDDYGTQSGTCSGVYGMGLYSQYSCTAPLGNLGYGSAAVAPAGLYDFTVRASGGVGAFHAYMLGAPVAW